MRICDRCESKDEVVECIIDLHITDSSLGRFTMEPYQYDLCISCRAKFWEALSKASEGMKHALFPNKAVSATSLRSPV